MFENLSPLSKQEFENMIANRTVYMRDSVSIEINEIRFVDVLHLPGAIANRHGVRIGKFIFKNCIFEKHVKFDNYSQAGSVEFTNCIFEDEVSFETTENITFYGYIEFKEKTTINLDRQWDFESVVVRKSLIIACPNTVHITKLSIDNINVGFECKECVLQIYPSVYEINIRNVYVDKAIIGGSMIKRINVDEVKIGEMGFTHGLETDLTIMNSEIGTVNLKCATNNDSVLNFTECKFQTLLIGAVPFKRFDIKNALIDKLIFSGVIEKDRYVTISKVSLKVLSFESLYNNGMISLQEIFMYSEGVIGMSASTLGKTDFILCDFEAASFEFENSKISEVFLAETDFPKKIRMRGPGRFITPYSKSKIKEKDKDYSQAQLSFGQISTAYQKQGDTVRSLEYQSREIEAHFKNLSFYDGKNKRISFTKISLCLNRLSNDFGRSWQRGVVFSFSVGIIFFYLVVICTKEYSIGFPITFDRSLLQAFLKFMNPLRFFESELLFKSAEGKPLLTLESGSYIFDFLGRIFVAYGFYQTIQAFRKYGRK